MSFVSQNWKTLKTVLKVHNTNKRKKRKRRKPNQDAPPTNGKRAKPLPRPASLPPAAAQSDGKSASKPAKRKAKTHTNKHKKAKRAAVDQPDNGQQTVFTMNDVGQLVPSTPAVDESAVESKANAQAQLNELLSRPAPPSSSSSSKSKSSKKTGNLTSVVAMDCEFVGVGKNGVENALARCSVVNYFGDVIYDKYVKVEEPVTDYRTFVSGIEPHHLTSPDAISYKQCQEEISTLLLNRVLVGHSINKDLEVLLLSHPRKYIRDTARYKLLCPHRPKSLQRLCKEHLGLDIQSGSHDSVEDARSVLALYKKFAPQWEKTKKKTKKKDKAHNDVGGKPRKRKAKLDPTESFFPYS